MLSNGDEVILTESFAPVRLPVIAAHYGLTVGSLRAEARRGNLVMSRVGGKDWTSHLEIERMFVRCRVKAVERDCGFEPPGETPVELKPPFGSSEKRDDNLALAAAKGHARRLKEGLPPISSPNMRRPVANAA